MPPCKDPLAPPAAAAGALASIKHLKESEIERAAQKRQVNLLRGKLDAAGIPHLENLSHIVPVMIKDPIKCKRISDWLLEDYGIYVQPINYPTVPKGTERLRINNVGIMTSFYSGNRGGMSLLGAFQAEVASTQNEGIIQGVTTDGIHCFDACGWYNNTNYRYTPQVKGYYMFNLSGQFATDMNGASIEQSFAFYLNGSSVSQYAYGISTNYGNYDYVQMSQMVFCNGTTDYVQAWMNSNRGPNINSTTKLAVLIAGKANCNGPRP